MKNRATVRMAAPRPRAGMTLVEVILAIVIMSGAMLGLANFTRLFQRNTNQSSAVTMASDLATQKMEEIKGYRVYSTLIATYNGNTITYPTSPLYKGDTLTIAAARCASCPTATNDYITITITVKGPGIVTPLKKTTVIASF